jgi:2-polyprenyl-3-methyl-5-hydroxy-6-metoxy-1,4-benzoquinol methylase
MEVDMINARTEEFIAENGEWTAMAIKLPDGTYTRAPAVDHRLKRLVQAAHDFAAKPLAECRVLDLACLEGQYAIEFALHGAEVVGIEGRQVSVDKCNYAKNALSLTKATFVRDDVRNLSAGKYGRFDIVICSGILYHLTAQDAANFLLKISEVCNGIALLDTHISVSGRTSVSVNGSTVHGHFYTEHYDDDDESAKSSRLWASLDNKTSFWFTEPALMNLMIDAGFTSVVNILAPAMPGEFLDRKTYLARKGAKSRILTSDLTHDEPSHYVPEGPNLRVDASQRPPGVIFSAAKRSLPPSVKNAIKPILRAIKVLPPDATPEFMKNKAAAPKGNRRESKNMDRHRH